MRCRNESDFDVSLENGFGVIRYRYGNEIHAYLDAPSVDLLEGWNIHLHTQCKDGMRLYVTRKGNTRERMLLYHLLWLYYFGYRPDSESMIHHVYNVEVNLIGGLELRKKGGGHPPMYKSSDDFIDSPDAVKIIEESRKMAEFLLDKS